MNKENTYTLLTYKVGTRRGMEDYPVDYTVRCPDGLILTYRNEGDGGPDYISRPTKEQTEHAAELALWCAMRKPKRAAEIANGPQKDENGRIKYGSTPTDEDVAIWAEEEGGVVQMDALIKRHAKRTVCWTVPLKPENLGGRELRYLRLRRGEKATAEWRAAGAAYVAEKFPNATIYGG